MLQNEGAVMIESSAVALNLLVAALLGAAVGFERQWRQRLAGLRTNTLVALGAASYVGFANLFGSADASPTRVAAQVVSGIGFLGAGIIFREGANVRGLNTAATLWCSAAVGLFAGHGAFIEAGLVAGLIILVNVTLRPLTGLINRQPATSIEVEPVFMVTTVCRAEAEAHVRALMLQGFSGGGLRLRRLNSENIEDSDRVEVEAEVKATTGHGETELEAITGRLSLEPDVTAARWRRQAEAIEE
jgi:putative Mg2+ transporter-C (MgtC) family protein